MRTLTAAASAKLSQNTHTEWIVVLEIEWGVGALMYYSDQDFAGCDTRVMDAGGFDTSMQLEGSGDSQELSIVLDDTDGAVRAIYDSVDVHKRPAAVYVVEKSTSLDDKILVFQGEVVTPIEWPEHQRSVSINILSKLNDRQVGFSMEEGNFPNIPDEALGKAWPLVFGQVCHLPAVKVRAPRRGYLLGGVGIKDFTLDARICQAMQIQCPSQSTGYQVFMPNDFGTNSTEVVDPEKSIGPDLECVSRRFGEICRLKDLLEQHESYEYSSVNIFNGIDFPQNENVRIFIEGAKFDGYFTGNTFTINQRYHPDFFSFDHQECREVPPLSYGEREFHVQIGGTGCNSAGGYWKFNQWSGDRATAATWIPADTDASFSANQTQEQAFQSCEEALTTACGMVGGPKDSWYYYDQMEESSFFWAPSGSEVFMESESEILYTVSLIPGTVDKVSAYRTAPNGFRYLTELTTNMYTVYNTDYGGYEVVEIGLTKSLSLYDDDWGDEIYVSFTSDEGPNPADVIEWLVNKYTDLTVDASSFAVARSLLLLYPTNFYVLDRPDVYDLINDVAYQSRCSVYIRNKVVFMTYLPYEPTSVRTLTESDILSGTFEEFLSETEDVYTTHNIDWQKGGATLRDDQDLEHELVLKYNVEKYGTVEENWNYFCLNHFELVNKTGTFWLIRKSSSWKKLKFTVPFKHLDIDVGDAVTINVAQFNGNPIKCIVESMTLNPSDYPIDMVVWTGIRSGESDPYFWVWPNQQSCVSVWPLAGDANGGGGYDFEVTPPAGHILLSGAHRDDQRIISSGSKNPSDLCDYPLVLTCDVSDYLEFDEVEPEIIAKQIAQSAARQAMETTMSGGGNMGGGNKKKEDPEACGVGPGCNYRVYVQWHTSHAQGRALALGGSAPGGPCGGPCGCVDGCPSCYGPIWTVCHTFGSAWGAKQSAEYWKSVYGVEDNWWTCRQTAVLDAYAWDGTHSGPGAADCESISGATNPGADAPTAEKKQPTGMNGEESYYDDYQT